MEEQVVETMTIGNKVIGIKDLEKKIGKFYTVLLNNDEHFVLAYDSDDYNRYLEPHVSYLNDFNTYKKERDRYKDDFDLLNSDFDYFIDLFGTDIEEINRFESEALEQDYTDNKFYKSLISSIFRTYKRCLEMKDKLDIYFSIDTEEKYFSYLIELLLTKKRHFVRYDNYLISEECIYGFEKLTCNYTKVKTGVAIFLVNLQNKKETFDHLRTFILFCNLYPEYYDRNWFMNYEYATGMSSKKLKRKLKQFKKYLIKLAKNNK